ncbi:hypothetical protein [Haliangium sp.]|uniref:hypothetical protein n=1 Tax=Haliangium sp. TaxID=2663208 RepID=UPI003D147391
MADAQTRIARAITRVIARLIAPGGIDNSSHDGRRCDARRCDARRCDGRRVSARAIADRGVEVRKLGAIIVGSVRCVYSFDVD